MAGKLTIDIPGLEALQRFGDIYEEAAKGMESKLFSQEVLRNAPDAIGPHWYGMRIRVRSKITGYELYLHTGLIYLPETKAGLMVEADRRNNVTVFDKIVKRVKGSERFVREYTEKDYFKLFMPPEQFQKLSGLPAVRQSAGLRRYLQSCIEAIVKAEAMEGYAVGDQQLIDAYRLAGALKKAVKATPEADYRVEINERDPDNFGQYASGYRYYLTSRKGIRMYAYFGVIYSYHKQPAGLFAEIDQPSNPSCFAPVRQHLKVPSNIEYSSSDERFIKLFMPEKRLAQLNRSGISDQERLLADFFNECSGILAAAADEREV